MRKHFCTIGSLAGVALLGVAMAARAQTPVNDPSARLKQVLPPDVATRVLAVIAKAKSVDLPTEALENRALKFAAKGVKGDSIAKSVADQEERMEHVRDTLEHARGHKPSGDEIDAGAEAVRKGVDGSKVSALAKSAPSGRSLAVPLYVIGSLVDRGLPSDSALARVEARLKARATDQDLEKMPSELPAQATASHGNQPAETGRALAETKRPGSASGAGQSGGSAGGPPAGVPANGGGKPATPPGLGKKPTTPPTKKP
jgi:cell pole-organizing protein PopZ